MAGFSRVAVVGASLLLAYFNVASAVLLSADAGAPSAPKNPPAPKKRVVTLLNVKGAGKSQNTAGEGTDADRLKRLTGLTEVEQDLKLTESEEVLKIKKLDKDILAQTKERNLARKREAQRKHEIAFVEAEIGKLRKRMQAKEGTAESAAASAATSATVDQQASAEASSVEAQASGAASEVASASASASSDVAASADASAATAADASAVAATDSTATETSDSAIAGQSSSQELANTAAQQAQAEQQQKLQDAAAAAERAAVERARKADEERRQQQEAQAKAIAEQQAAQEKAIAEQRAKENQAKNAIADSADDSFKNFMKEEDGEDEQGNADYEDSANALAGAIGWDRNKIESNADSAVKQLTEAIGGKKAVASVQGLMAGIR